MIDNKEIREKLFELSDNQYKQFHSGLCPGTNNIIGVRVPILKNYAKEIAKQDYKAYLENARDDYYEEVMLQGIVIGFAKMNIEESQYYLTRFIPKIDNWAICDVTIATLKLTKKYKKEMWEFIQNYLKSSKEFELRFAIVMMLDYYITQDYIEQVLQILNNIKHDGYYVKMAVAWAISVAFTKFPEKTWQLIKNNKLDDFTYNKSLQKIVESYRVDDMVKQEIKQMKR